MVVKPLNKMGFSAITCSHTTYNEQPVAFACYRHMNCSVCCTRLSFIRQRRGKKLFEHWCQYIKSEDISQFSSLTCKWLKKNWKEGRKEGREGVTRRLLRYRTRYWQWKALRCAIWICSWTTSTEFRAEQTVPPKLVWQDASSISANTVWVASI